jgi:hypothetical protein
MAGNGRLFFLRAHAVARLPTANDLVYETGQARVKPETNKYVLHKKMWPVVYGPHLGQLPKLTCDSRELNVLFRGTGGVRRGGRGRR